MAGQKISQLTLRETLSGSEEIPFRDGDTNGKLTPDGIKKHVQPDLTGYLKKDEAETAYVKREAGKRLMTDEEADKLSNLSNYDDTGLREAVRKNADDIAALKYGEAAYCVGAWDDSTLSPESVETVGEKSFLNRWGFYLIDTTDNAGTTTAPVGRLRKNNLLRFEDGSFAPTVGITEAMRAACDAELYLDAAHTEKYCDAGAFDAAAFYNEHGMDTPLYTADGAEVAHILRPWETTETKYTVGIGREDTVYLLDNVVGDSGKLWKGLFSRPQTWDGIDVSKYPLAPTAMSPCPVCTVGDTPRAFFYLYEGETNCKSGAGQDNLCTMFLNGRTYPRVNDTQQVTSMQRARALNADTTRPYPFAEGGYHALNAYITAMEALHGTRNLHASGLFGSGISSNDGCANEAGWLASGGVRYRPAGGDAWKYAAWNGQGDIYHNATPKRVSFSLLANMEYPKEQCMESQMAASFAVETGVAEGAEFEFYGATYWYRNVPGADGLQDGDMNARVYKRMAQTFDAFDSAGNAATWDMEVILRMSLFGGVSLSGDVFVYWGGGAEAVGTCEVDPATSRAGNPVSLYLEPDQTKWHSETALSKNDRGAFGFESAYPKAGETVNPGDGYMRRRFPYAGYVKERGGNLSTGECCYCWNNSYWSSVIGQRARISLRFRGDAYHAYCSPRALHAPYAASTAYRIYAGSAQALIGGAAPPPAE